MPKCYVDYHYDRDRKAVMWTCKRGLTPSKHIATAERCWRHNCPGIRKIDFNITTCAHLNCSEPVRERKDAKYCSLKCKSKESSRLYRLKKKNEER